MSYFCEHYYGENIHILNHTYLSTLLQKVSHPETKQPYFSYLIKELYNQFLSVVIREEFATKELEYPTRMKTLHPKEGILRGKFIDPNSKAVCVDLARAGSLPSQVLYENLNLLLNCDNVRQDHIYINRKVNDKNEVIGVNFTGAKIGGGVDGAYVIIPDPMGATGKTINYTLDHYKQNIAGKALKYISMHLIITPEYIKNVKKAHPDLKIYALRLDRGLSSPEVLNSTYGKFWEQERGLNDHQYIVPGAGGLGELLNNSFV